MSEKIKQSCNLYLIIVTMYITVIHKTKELKFTCFS